MSISLQNLTKSIGASVLVDHLSLDIHDGEFVVLLGPAAARRRRCA